MTKSKTMISTVLAIGTVLLASLSLPLMAETMTEQSIEEAVAAQAAQMQAQVMPQKIQAQTLFGFQMLSHNLANNHIRTTGSVTLMAEASAINNDSELGDSEDTGEVE